jgi:hypothetical protein
LSDTDRVKVFTICGGIPYYLKVFSQSDSIDVNICNTFLNEYSALAREPEFLLRKELKELKQYNGILSVWKRQLKNDPQRQPNFDPPHSLIMRAPGGGNRRSP